MFWGVGIRRHGGLTRIMLPGWNFEGFGFWDWLGDEEYGVGG